MVDIGYKLNTMLVIKNIKKLEGTFCHNRGLVRVVDEKDITGNPVYSFHFGPVGDNKGWNKKAEVRMNRNMHEGRGAYELFTMGLGMVSQMWVTPDNLKTQDGLSWEISKSLAKAKVWWETEASPSMK